LERNYYIDVLQFNMHKLMAKAIIIIQALLAFVLITQSASALGISSVSFVDVDQGKAYNQTATLINSPNDFDNHFVIEIDGAIKDWIKVSPAEFDLKKGEVKLINLTLEVPKDARLGEITGTITAVGKKTVPSAGAGEGASVGYAVATKGSIYANVVKPGAVASVEITGVEVPSNVPVGSVAKLTVTSRNNGNVVTTANFKLEVKKDGNVVASIPGTPTDFTLGEEKSVKLFWDTQGAAEGRYDAYIEATTIARGTEKTTSSSYKPVPIIVGGEKGGINSTLIAATGATILIIIILAVVLKRRK
jgi:hypothetical protein